MFIPKIFFTQNV